MSDENKKNDELNNKDATELLRELLAFEKKEARYQKVTSILIFCLVVIMGIVSFMIVPVAVQTLTTANETIVMAQEALGKITEEMDNINTMTASITATSDNMNSMVVENSEELSKAVESMSNIDFDGLNKAIKDLEDAVGPFAKMTRIFN